MSAILAIPHAPPPGSHDRTVTVSWPRNQGKFFGC
jgi:hypothetical protein